MNKEIVFEKETITLDIPSGKPHTYWFTAYNLSDSEITRISLSNSCYCTIGNPPKVFKPKEKTTFEVIFDPENSTGYYVKSITLGFDNGQKTKLRISGKIIEQEK